MLDLLLLLLERPLSSHSLPVTPFLSTFSLSLSSPLVLRLCVSLPFRPRGRNRRREKKQEEEDKEKEEKMIRDEDNR